MLDRVNGFVICSFTLAAKETRPAHWSLRIKGRERRKSQRSKKTLVRKISVE